TRVGLVEHDVGFKWCAIAVRNRREGRSGLGVPLSWATSQQTDDEGVTHVVDIQALLGDEAESLLGHESKGIPRDDLNLPGADYIDRVFSQTDRSPQVARNLQSLFAHGRLAGTGYVSILPVDQGIEHSAAASFAPNPQYFDPANIVKLAIEGGCNGVASTSGVLAAVSRRYAHKIPFIVKLNHNELLTSPNKFDQVMFGSV